MQSRRATLSLVKKQYSLSNRVVFCNNNPPPLFALHNHQQSITLNHQTIRTHATTTTNTHHDDEESSHPSSSHHHSKPILKQKKMSSYNSRAKLPDDMQNVFEMMSEKQMAQLESQLPPPTITYSEPTTLITEEEDVSSSSSSSSFNEKEMVKVFAEQMNNIIQKINPSISSEIKIGLAVSGGIDSMSLSILMYKWKMSLPLAVQHKVSIVAITVNHAKREESQLEVVQVKQWMKQKYQFDTLIYNVKWQNEKINQETCREKRLSCLADAKARCDLNVILLGQHLDDQVEVFLYRMALGSGLQGLSGVPDVTHLIGCDFARPLQLFRKQQLTQLCIENNQPWLSDPTNFDQHEFRGSVRACLPKWENYNISHEEIIHAMHSIRNLVQVMNHTIGNFIQTNVKFDRNLGCVAINLNGLLTLLPKTHALTLIGALSQYVSNKKYVPRTASLETVYNFFKKAQNNRELENTVTCGLCLFVVKSNTIYVAREPTPTKKSSTLSFNFEETVLFDNRYKITLSHQHKWNSRVDRGAQFDFWQNGDSVGYEEDAHSSREQNYHQRANTSNSSLRVRGFKDKDWQVVARSIWNKTRYNTPWFLRYGIPVIEDSQGILAIPLLGYKRNRDIYWKCEFISDTNVIQKFVNK